MYITKIDDPEYCRVMKKSIKKNNGFCPDALVHTPEMKCPCKAFLEQGHNGLCEMGYLYLHTEDDEEE